MFKRHKQLSEAAVVIAAITRPVWGKRQKFDGQNILFVSQTNL